MVRHCTCGLYFTRRWLVKYRSQMQCLTILHSSSCNDNIHDTNTKSTPKDSDLVGGASLRDRRESTTTRSLANFSREKWAGCWAEGKYPPPITSPTSAREKLVWPARLNNALVRRDERDCESLPSRSRPIHNRSLQSKTQPARPARIQP